MLLLMCRKTKRRSLWEKRTLQKKFWKIINQYYNAGKAWVPAKNIDKLKIVIEQNMRRRELIDKMCGM